MPSLVQRCLHFFDLRLLVWVPGLWFILGGVVPSLLTQWDRHLFFTGASLSRGIEQPPAVDILELSGEEMQQLLSEPADHPALMVLIDNLASRHQKAGIILPALPRASVWSTEFMPYADESMLLAWQQQAVTEQTLRNWLLSSGVVIGSDQLAQHLVPVNNIAVNTPPWKTYYAWLPAMLQPQMPPAENGFGQANNSWQILPVAAASRRDGLSLPLLIQQDGQWYPTMGLALIDSATLHSATWQAQTRLLTTPPLHTNTDGSVIPLFQSDGPFPPVYNRYTLHRFAGQYHQAAAGLPLLIGTVNDPALPMLAGLLQSVYNDNYYTSPWWFYGVEKILLLLIMLYALWLLPRLSGGVGLLASLLCLLLLVVVQLGGQITQSRWLPLGVVMQYLVWAFMVMMLWRQQQKPQRQLQQRHQDIACQLSQQLMQQGQLEQAVAALDHCATSERVLQLLYDIGGQHERKRRVADALAVYQVLHRRQRSFRDVAKRVKHLGDKHHAPTDDMELVLSKTVVLADPHSRPQFGRYNIERELGRGAMGVVYLGHDPHIARRVAIKTLDYSRYDTGELVAVKARFFREAEAAGRLRHPNIVTVYDVGEEHDLAFIAMDYVAGQPLSHFIAPKSLLPAAEVYRIVAEVAEALAYAHSRQIVHRDIKPGNILYHPDSKKVTVTDFGIARIVSDARTQTGEIVGSPLYMSPEQVKGQKVGEASDIFSLAVTFFQLLSGELPFHGDNIAGLSYQIIHGKHKSIRDLRSQVPVSASRIINKALQKEPGDRYSNAADMARSLRKALQKDFA